MAVELVKRGIAENPDEWRLYQDLGFLYSIHLKDYKKAAEAYLEGSKNPPRANLDESDGRARRRNRQHAGNFTSDLEPKCTPPPRTNWSAARALQHIHSLDAALGLKRLNESSEDYWRKFGRFPTSMQELRDAGLVGGTLEDPGGLSLRDGPERGAATRSQKPHRPRPRPGPRQTPLAPRHLRRKPRRPPGFSSAGLPPVGRRLAGFRSCR